MFHRRYSLLAAAFTLSLVSCIVAWAVHRPSENAVAAKTLTAVTYNVGDVHRSVFPAADTAACILAAGKPDILLLQEMPRGKACTALKAALACPYECRGTESRGKLGGLMILSRYPIIESRQIALPTWKKRAGALCAIIDLDGTLVMACSVHLDEVDPKARNDTGNVFFTWREALDIIRREFFTDTVRTASASVLAQKLGEYSRKMPMIVGGDFNTVPGSRTIRCMTDRFHDATWPGKAYFTGTYHKIAFPMLPRIDYLFVSDRFSVGRSRVVQKSAGDHYPLAARLHLKPCAGG